MDPVTLFLLCVALMVLMPRVSARLIEHGQLNQSFKRVRDVWETVERRQLIPMDTREFGVSLPNQGFANWAFKTGDDPKDIRIGYWKLRDVEWIVLLDENENGAPMYEFKAGHIKGKDHKAVYAAECLLGRIQGVIRSAGQAS